MIKRILLASGVSAVLLAQLVLSPPAFAQKAPHPRACLACGDQAGQDLCGGLAQGAL